MKKKQFDCTSIEERELKSKVNGQSTLGLVDTSGGG